MTTQTTTEVVTSEGQHWYPAQGRGKKGIFYPSVTTILSVYPKGVGFDRYLAKQESWESAQEILQAAGKRGTNVHTGTFDMETKKATLHREMYTLEEWQMLIGFVNWKKSTDLFLKFAEYPVISDKLKTGGTIDRVYMSSNGQKHVILDIKTSSAIHGNYWCQVAAYAEMYEQKTGTTVDEVAILRLAPRRKEGYEIKTRNRSFWKHDFKTFQHVQAIWNELHPDAQPQTITLPTTLAIV